MPPRALLLLLGLGGCAGQDWRAADLQLDIDAAAWPGAPDEALIRICVEPVGNYEEARGAGRLAFTGIPAGEPVAVTVDVLDPDAEERFFSRAGPATLDAGVPYDRVSAAACAADDCAACAAEGARVAAGEPDWLLAVRFFD